MSKFDFKEILGKRLMGFRSSFCRVNVQKNIVEYRIAYSSVILFSVQEKVTPFARAYLIESKWREVDNGGDDFEIDVKPFGDKYRWASLEDRFTDRPSSISIAGFVVSSVDIYGYNTKFNLIAPTQHILHLKSRDGQELIIKPESSGMGLLVSLAPQTYDSVFKNGPQSEYVYHVKKF